MGLSCKEDSGWGFGIMDIIHTTLDAAGMVPILGIVPDLLNAGIYTVEGDMINAGLSGAAAIPLVGQAAKAGKYGAKAIKKLDDAAETATKKAVSKLMKKHKVACFKRNKKGSNEEYDRQLKGQQDGINDMTVKEYLDNREAYKQIGRKGTGAAQQKARDSFKDKLVKMYEKELADSDDLFGQEATDKATELANAEMKTLNALHNPDMIAGGYDTAEDLGDARKN